MYQIPKKIKKEDTVKLKLGILLFILFLIELLTVIYEQWLIFGFTFFLTIIILYKYRNVIEPYINSNIFSPFP
jgi:hypothetical protein